MVERSGPVTRREMVALVGAAALAGCSAGPQTTRRETPTAGVQVEASGGQTSGEVVHAFVGAYHWGFFVLDANGVELPRVTLSTGDELRFTLFSVEADGAVAALPRAVRRNLPTAAERARRNELAIPTPRGTTLTELHEAAEAAYPDHALAIVSDEFLGRPLTDPWSGHYGPHGPGSGRGPGPGPAPGMGPGMGPGVGVGMHGPWSGGVSGGALAPPTYLWHHSTVPSELGFVVDTPGSFGFVCPVYCGYGHPYMVAPGRVVVDE